MEILGRARKSPRISENFGNASDPFLRSLNDLWNFCKTSETVQKCFSDVFMIFKIFGKSSEVFWNLLKFSENFGKLWKQFKSNFQTFLWLLNFRKIFGNLRKCSEIVGNDFRMWSKMFLMGWKVSELAFEKSSDGLQQTVARKERRESIVEYYPLHITRYIPQNMQR